MLAGINYPWTVLNGKPIYGCDFGTNVWGSHAGVTTHEDDVRRDFTEMAAAGIEVARWFVFTDGRGGVRWQADGGVAGLADGFFEDMDCALEIARTAGVRLCLVLFDFSWMQCTAHVDDLGKRVFVTRPDVLRTAHGLAQILDAVIDPFLDRYRHREEIASFDVMNEPDWVTQKLEFHIWHAAKTSPFTIPELRRFVRAITDRIHDRSRILTTVGGGRVRHAAEWDRAEYGLDFIQLHSYPDVRHPERDDTLIGKCADALGVSKPVLIGEFPANGGLTDYLALARDGGYLGAWPWSFKGVDACGAADLDALRNMTRLQSSS